MICVVMIESYDYNLRDFHKGIDKILESGSVLSLTLYGWGLSSFSCNRVVYPYPFRVSFKSKTILASLCIVPIKGFLDRIVLYGSLRSCSTPHDALGSPPTSGDQ